MKALKRTDLYARSRKDMRSINLGCAFLGQTATHAISSKRPGQTAIRQTFCPSILWVSVAVRCILGVVTRAVREVRPAFGPDLTGVARLRAEDHLYRMRTAAIDGRANRVPVPLEGELVGYHDVVGKKPSRENVEGAVDRVTVWTPSQPGCSAGVD
jgi:hypothetical protein